MVALQPARTGIMGGLKFSPMKANMETRLESKIHCNSRKQAVLLTKFPCNIQLAALSKFLDIFLFN